MAARSVARRPLLHPADPAGSHDVRRVEGQSDWCAAQSADDDDAVLHARFHDAVVPALRVGVEPLLCGAEHREPAAAIQHRDTPPEGAGEAEALGRHLAPRPMLADPIVALATPPGRSALALIRVSGRGAFAVAARAPHPFRPGPPRTLRPLP